MIGPLSALGWANQPLARWCGVSDQVTASGQVSQNKVHHKLGLPHIPKNNLDNNLGKQFGKFQTILGKKICGKTILGKKIFGKTILEKKKF